MWCGDIRRQYRMSAQRVAIVCAKPGPQVRRTHWWSDSLGETESRAPWSDSALCAPVVSSRADYNIGFDSYMSTYTPYTARSATPTPQNSWVQGHGSRPPSEEAVLQNRGFCYTDFCQI